MTKITDEIVNQVLKGEHWQSNLSGLKWTPHLKESALRKHTKDIRLWRAEKDIEDILNDKETPYGRMIDASCVTVLKDLESKKIKEIGFNRPDDLFTNNWATWLSSLIQNPSGSIFGYTMYDTSNIARTTIIGGQYSATVSVLFNGIAAGGTQIQFGSGVTAAARTNFAIQTPLVTAPESGKFGSGNAAGINGTISFGNTISAGGSGTINEIGLFGYFNWNSGSNYTFMLTHDILGAGVAFVAGNPLVGTFAITV